MYNQRHATLVLFKLGWLHKLKRIVPWVGLSSLNVSCLEMGLEFWSQCTLVVLACLSIKCVCVVIVLVYLLVAQLSKSYVHNAPQLNYMKKNLENQHRAFLGHLNRCINDEEEIKHPWKALLHYYLSFILIKKDLGRGVFPRSQDIKRTSKMGSKLIFPTSLKSWNNDNWVYWPKDWWSHGICVKFLFMI